MILASASPRRRELLGQLGFELEVRPADVDETRRTGEHPRELVSRLARTKARAVFEAEGTGTDGLLLAADTIVWMGDEALGKPSDAADARAMLHELSGRTHHVSTGVSVLYQAPGWTLRERSFVETTDVTFFELTDAQIDAYVSSGECADKAGAYAIQGAGRLLVRGISGDYDNVVGLPVCRVVRAISTLVEEGGVGAGATAPAPLLERLLEEHHA